MKLYCILLTLLISHGIELRADPYSEFASPQAFLVVGKIVDFSRSDTPLATADGDLIRVSNSCGYDTGIIEIVNLVRGEYESEKVSAHIHLNEFCEGLFQSYVEDYLLALRWNGGVWEVELALSSRLVPDSAGNLWLVEPELIEALGHFGITKEEANFESSRLENIALAASDSIGIGLETGASREERIEELRGYLPIVGNWSNNPLYFREGISLARFLSWAAANKALNTDAGDAGTG